MSNIFSIYKKLFSPLWPSLQLIFPVACKFHPTCSQYSSEALSKYGVIKGLSLTVKRILRCSPFCTGGVDLVP